MIRRLALVLLTAFTVSTSVGPAGARQSAPAAAPSPAPATPQPAPTLVATPLADPTMTPEPGAATPAARPAPGTTPSAAARISAALGMTPLGLASAQPYASFMRTATRQTGVIDLVRKDDELFFDLRPDNFGKNYIVLPSIERGVGGDVFAGRVYDPVTITFKRVGHRVYWITPNDKFVAPRGSAAANSLAISVGDTVLFSTPIVAEDTKGDHVVVAPSMFNTDFEGIGADLGHSAPGSSPAVAGLLLIVSRPNYAVDATKSYYGQTKAFPTNDEISVNLAFNGPENAGSTVPDGRGIPVTVHYSVVAPPERDPKFVPRLADDRVGYFITARKRYGNDNDPTPFERFIERWNLDSGPITFYLTNEIPPEYRDTVRRGILAWNEAFAKAGHPNAIVVKDPPTEPGWDPDDARYTTVRWITSDQPGFAAYSPHFSDPETGQIIRAEVVVDGESMRAIKRGYVDRISPSLRLRSNAYADTSIGALDSLTEALDETSGQSGSQECRLEEQSLVQAALGAQLLALDPRTTAATRENYAQAWLYSTVMHEVGHTLGLRHNFRGSTAYSYAQLHDPAFTRAHGTTASVMDYTPVNLAAPGERQADYFPTHLGIYDEWAIDYGYRTFANVRSTADEAIPLSRIASRSTEPGLAYGTDEDTIGNAVDPRVELFDLSSDPLRYDGDQLRIDTDLAARLTHRYSGDHRTYQDIRSGFITLLNNELQTTQLAAQYVGGLYTSRSHRDQPGAPAPFAPIPRATEKRAFDLVSQYVFASSALQFSPELLNDAEPSRYGLHWDASISTRPDFPIREVVAEVQDAAIDRIFSPANLTRIADNEVKQSKPGETMSLADLFAWSNASIYDDIGRTTIAPTHRELQRRFTDLQMQIVALPAPIADQLDLPRETQEIARYQLRKLAAALDASAHRAHDAATTAHIADLSVRVHGVLSAGNVRAI
jgi:hypothetical protein